MDQVIELIAIARSASLTRLWSSGTTGDTVPSAPGTTARNPLAPGSSRGGTASRPQTFGPSQLRGIRAGTGAPMLQSARHDWRPSDTSPPPPPRRTSSIFRLVGVALAVARSTMIRARSPLSAAPALWPVRATNTIGEVTCRGHHAWWLTGDLRERYGDDEQVREERDNVITVGKRGRHGCRSCHCQFVTLESLYRSLAPCTRIEIPSFCHNSILRAQSFL